MIADYTALQAQIAFEANRTDLSAQIPLYIALAEKDIERMLDDSWLLKKSAQLTILAGATVVPLPDDLQRLDSASYADGNEITITTQQDRAEFAQKTNQYASIVGKALVLHASSEEDQTLNIVYKAKIEPLSASNLTNEVFLNLWDAYFYASNAHLQRAIKDKASEQEYMQRAAASVNAFTSINNYAGTNNYVSIHGVV